MRDSVIQGYFPRGFSGIMAMRQRLAPTGAPVQRYAANTAANAVQLPPAMTRFAPGPGQPLPAEVRQKMEAFFGASFADVRVHVGTAAPSLGATAFTQGRDIHFAPGQYNPSTLQGQKILGHELAHVVQQRAGRVRNPFGSGVAVVQDSLLEAEAERWSMRASAHQASLQAKLAVQRAVPVHIAAAVQTSQHSYRIVAGAGPAQVGSVMVHERDQASIEVTDLTVSAVHRGKGIGQALMVSAARMGHQMGKSKVVLASRDNGTGHLTRWYRNMGFTQVGFERGGVPKLEAPINRLVPGAAQPKTEQSKMVQPKMARSGGSLPRPVPVRSAPSSPAIFRRPGGPIQMMIKASGLESTVADLSGQIYGIWKNEQYPNKINDSISLDAKKCLYIGKTARGEDLGGRFREHCIFDSGKPWCIDKNADYSNNDDDCWPYVVRNILIFKNMTRFDVAVLEQYYIQHYLQLGAKLLNARNEITLKKYNDLKDKPAFTTKKDYQGWNPKDYKDFM